MLAFVILGTPADQIELVIGLVLATIAILWMIASFIQWISRKPWKRDETATGVDSLGTATAQGECDNQSPNEFDSDLLLPARGS